MEAIELGLCIVILITACALVWVIGKRTSGESDRQSFVAEVPVNLATGTANSRYYGESNPINSYAKDLKNTGMYNTYTSGLTTLASEREKLLEIQGVLNDSELESHKYYYQSNVGKYPLQIVGDVHEMRTTRSPYVAGTRSMRAVNISVGESQVPDKLERTVRPSE